MTDCTARLLRVCLAAACMVLFASPSVTAAQTVAAHRSTPGPTAIRVIDDRGRSVELPGPAQRIIALLPSLAESVCALGACDRLVGVDRSTDWPASIRSLPRLGGLEDPAIERIVALRPDLVLVPVSWRATSRLEAAGLKVVALEPTSMTGTRRMLDVVASLLGIPDAGSSLWLRIQAQIDVAAASVPASVRGQSVYFEVSEAPHAAGEASVVGELLTALGLRNIVSASMGAFPRLNPEFVVRASPDWIMGPSNAVNRMPSRPGWAGMLALKPSRSCPFVPEAYDAIVRPGPRLGEASQRIAQCLANGARPESS
ncbi:MAG: helical backbone metal receptor [Burkholderiales bacterium]|nr:helical backbone metal receptor [Burkholderiales bacterium]